MDSSFNTINRIFDTFAVTSRSRYVYVYDMEKNIARWSKNAVEYFGLTGEYVYNASTVWQTRIHMDDKDKYGEYMDAAFRGLRVDPTIEYRARNKNGEYVGQLTGQKAFETDATNACIARETYASGYFGFNGCVNDVRIYDHCLSAAEVHEIS